MSNMYSNGEIKQLFRSLKSMEGGIWNPEHFENVFHDADQSREFYLEILDHTSLIQHSYQFKVELRTTKYRIFSYLFDRDHNVNGQSEMGTFTIERVDNRIKDLIFQMTDPRIIEFFDDLDSGMIRKIKKLPKRISHIIQGSQDGKAYFGVVQL